MTDAAQPEVHVLPAGITFPVAQGETVMAAAARAGYYWPTICKGHGRCGRCAMVILEGAGDAGPMRQEERATLERTHGQRAADQERLACQTTIDGPIAVHRRGVRSVADLTEGTNG